MKLGRGTIYGLVTLVFALLLVSIALWSYRVYIAAFLVTCGAVTLVIVIWRLWIPGHLAIQERKDKKLNADRDYGLRDRVISIGERAGYSTKYDANGTIEVIAPQWTRAQVNELAQQQEQQQIAAPQNVIPQAPPFSQIISQVQAGRLFLGQSKYGPIWGDIIDLLSTLIAGRPGTGKSTQLRNVCGQVLKIDGVPVIFDPHGSIVDDLGGALQCAESAPEIVESAQWLDVKLTSRLTQRRQGRRDFRPVLLLVDELPIVSSMAPEALETVRRIVLEGRKVGMFALISGQGVPASLFGDDGTLVRDSMSSRYVFATSPRQARMAGIENEIAKPLMKILEEAGPGKAILATATRKPEIVAVPNTTVNDIRLLVSSSGSSGNTFVNATETPRQASFYDRDTQPFTVSGSLVDPEREEPITEPGNVVGNDLKETIRRMRKHGMPHRDIASLVGLSGRKYNVYQQICAELGLEA